QPALGALPGGTVLKWQAGLPGTLLSRCCSSMKPSVGMGDLRHSCAIRKAKGARSLGPPRYVSSSQLGIFPAVYAAGRNWHHALASRLPRFHRARPSTFLDIALWN